MNLFMIFQILLYSSITGSIITLGILLVKWLSGNRLSATWNYYIWFLVLLILLVPYTPMKVFNIEFPILQSQSDIHQNAASDIEKVPESAALQAVPPDNQSTKALVEHGEALPLKQEESKISALSDKTVFNLNYQLLGQIWSIGAAITLLYILLVYFRQKLKIRILPRCTDGETLSLLEECKKVLNIYTDVVVIYCQDIKSPSVLGFINYKLLLPKEMMDGLSSEEKRFIFLHELSHLKRKDTMINWISVILQVLYWFNPVIWYAFYRMRQDCEPACDARVLRYMNSSERIKYGEMLLNFIKLFSQSGWIPGSAGVANSSQCRRRIILISDFDKKTKKRSTVAVLLTFLLVFAGLFLQSVNSTVLASSSVVDKQAIATKDSTSTVNAATKDSTSTANAATKDSTSTVNAATKDSTSIVNAATKDSTSTVNAATKDIASTVNKASKDIASTVNEATKDIASKVNAATKDIVSEVNEATKDIPSTANAAVGKNQKYSNEETILLEMPKKGGLSVKNQVGNIYVRKTEESKIKLRIVKEVNGTMTEEAKEVLNNVDVSTRLHNDILEIYAVTKDKKQDFWAWKDSAHSTANIKLDFYVEVPRDFENYALSLDVGKVEVCDQKGVFHIDNQIGNIIMNKVAVEKSSYITLDIGEIEIETDVKNLENLDITCDTGNVNLTIPKNSALNLKANTETGSIHGNMISTILINEKDEGYEESGFSGRKFSGELNGGGKASVQLEVDVGDIRIDGN